jgi:outer membrane receptor for ferrienterochelin and colicins
MGCLMPGVNGAITGNKTRATASYNFYKQNGIDYNKEQFGNQQDPYHNHTVQANISHQFSPRTRLLVYGRYFAETSDNAYEIADSSLQTQQVGGNTRIWDANVNTSLQHNFSNKLSTTFRVYGTGYQSQQQLNNLKDGTPFYIDDFQQQFYRFRKPD